MIFKNIENDHFNGDTLIPWYPDSLILKQIRDTDTSHLYNSNKMNGHNSFEKVDVEVGKIEKWKISKGPPWDRNGKTENKKYKCLRA